MNVVHRQGDVPARIGIDKDAQVSVGSGKPPLPILKTLAC
jgi:hypothetical protein